MLEIKHLSYTAEEEGEEKAILHDISLTIEPGRLVVITGPNGGGKTTLAKAIMGLVEASAGQILWNGEDITHLSITERSKRASVSAFSSRRGLRGSPSATC